MIGTTHETVPLRVAFVGHVDHGKSTLIGRILHDAGALPPGLEEEIRRTEDGAPDFALAVDRLREERERRITIDATRITVPTASRDLEIIDAPGHAEFLRNMLSGATCADSAVMLVDADAGLGEQTFRHALLLRLVGVDRVLVAVNKLDLRGYDEGRFREVASKTGDLLRSIGSRAVAVVPVAARHGDNVVRPSDRTPWYDGPTVLDALEGLPAGPARDLPVRMPVQDALARDGRRVLVGRVEGGGLAPGDPVVAVRAGAVYRVEDILRLDGTPGPVEAGDCPGVILEGDPPLGRGEVLADPAAPASAVSELRATIFWMRPGARVPGEDACGVVRIATQEAPARIVEILRRFDSATLTEIRDRRRLETTDVAEVILRLASPLVAEPHVAFPPLGRLTLESERDVVAAGIIRGIEG
jgi:small GTP-binding protein